MRRAPWRDMPDSKPPSIDRGGPGQSGAAAGVAHFDEEKRGIQPYPGPNAAVPSGSRSRWDRSDIKRAEGSTPRGSAPIPRPHVPAEEDLQLHAAIMTALRGVDIDVSKLEVIVTGGDVTLIGTVEDGPSLSLAEDTVEHIPGVNDVHNQILVEGR